MPSFVGRLARHSNRSQHALAEPPPPAAAPPVPGPASGSGSVPAAAESNAGALLLADAPAGAAPKSGSSLLSSATALSSCESFVDAQLRHLPPTSSRPPSAVLDGQQLLTPVDAASRPQKQRYGASLRLQPPLHQSPHHQSPHQTPLQLQQQGHAASGSADVPSPPWGLHQPPIAATAPEKRSTRRLIKGIFSSSARSSHDPGSSPHSSYDNTAGLARRPSKRVSNSPAAKTSLQQQSPLRDVGEIDQYPYPAPDSIVDFDSPDAPAPAANRQLSSEQLGTSPYDDDVYRPLPPNHQQQQPPLQHRGTLHIQEQQIRHDLLQKPVATYGLSSQGRQQQQLQHPIDSPQASEPRVLTGYLGRARLQPNPETVSQLSHTSSITDSDPQSASTSPSIHYSTAQPQGASSTTTHPHPIHISDNPSSQPAMAPPGGTPPPNRRVDAEKALRGQVEPPPPYRQSGLQAINSISPVPTGPGQVGAQNTAYRGDRAPPYEGPAGVDPGRNSPQPSNPDRDAEGEKQFKDLLAKYKNVKRLYYDGKSQIEQLTSQVEQLQNAVANQRMSQSRTAWDDNEYTTRFNRLNGAINNLSFNIRKDWRSLPQWLESYVSADALKTGKQEMTAVGRAIISRWIMDEIFNKCFHPGLDAHLSSQLKEIELSIRGNAYTMHSQEEFDALTTKVVNWRMATLDGLQKKLGPSAMGDNRAMLMSKATMNLTAYLYQHLSSPPPAGVEGSTSIVVELAVAIATNLPLESRDVAIMYPLPGDAMQPHLMEVEKTGLPLLDSLKSEMKVAADGDEDEVDKDKNAKTRGDKARTGLSKDGNKVRFAGFVALEVRGRQVPMKAPVWTL